MRIIPNDIITTLLRTLPLIMENVSADALAKSTRLNNAVRQTKKIIQRLNKIQNEQQDNND